MENLIRRLQQGAFDDTLVHLYGPEGLDTAHSRCTEVLTGFQRTFGAEAEALFSAPGRTELGGNHTDHQHGRVLAASVDLDILAAVSPNQSGMLRVQSQGYPLLVVDLRELTPVAGEENTTAALIRGVAARMAALGCPLQGAGLDAYMISNVPGGSGLSSSAAFEVLMGTILNELFFGGRCSAVELAQIGQYAENVFFGKPCGLMDQTASSGGGGVAIDFADTARPAVERMELDLASEGYALCILNSGADHADLTGEYAAITDELKAVCACFGKAGLREGPEADFLTELPRGRQAAGDRAGARAMHVYAENRRAAAEAEALKSGDFGKYLELVRQSGASSTQYLQNVTPTGQPTRQELLVTIGLCQALLGDRGAARVHGGGFGGTAQAYVPLDMLEDFKARTEAVLGKGSCHVVCIRPVGGVRLA